MPDLTPSQEDRDRHLRVLEEAHDIYVERSKERGQLWKEFEPEDAKLHIKSKSARVIHRDGFAEDDALDLINYAVFYIRHMRAVGLPKEEK